MRKNKRGEMSLYGALVAFALLLLLYSFFEFFNTSTRIQRQEDMLSSSLGDVCLENTIKDYDFLKYRDDGNIPKMVEKEKYMNAIFQATGFTKSGKKWTKTDCAISNAAIEFDSVGYCFKLTYTMEVPFKVLGKSIDTVVVNKVASAALNSKV